MQMDGGSMMTGIRVWCAMLFMCQVASAELPAENPSAAFIQRTMKSLSESTPESSAVVRIMFYGQSITAQPWTGMIEQSLKRRFPSVRFEFKNGAIGGFFSSRLKRTADHDLYPWYPDLLIFHVYGPMKEYEDIIRSVRERTTSEIILWTDHISCQPEADQQEQNLREGQIADIARRYNCMLINVRSKWRDYLAKTGTTANALLQDHIHLNEAGWSLMARFIGEELLRIPELGDGDAASGTIVRVDADSYRHVVDGEECFTLNFKGNRIMAISDGKSVTNKGAEVLLDGNPVESYLEMWAATRPSTGPDIWMPAIKQVSFKSIPGRQDWTLTALPDSSSDANPVHFSVQGSITGEDGTGWSSASFRAPSEKVFIDSMDWLLAWQLEYRKKTLPQGFQITWKTYPLCEAEYKPTAEGIRTLLIQGCRNDAHVLTIRPAVGGLGIGSFLIYSPAGSRAP